jgi:tight adherence protein C
MEVDLLLALGAVFVGVALTAGLLARSILLSRAPAQRRLDALTAAPATDLVLQAPLLNDTASPLAKKVAAIVPKSPKEMTMLRRRLSAAGYRSINAAITFAVAKLLAAAALAGTVVLVFGRRGILPAVGAILVGYLLPDFWLARQTRRRQRVIRNGLPDALDLFIVCLEAGSSLDQAIVKASDELDIAYPALAEELRLVTTEIRAGKQRLEAFKNFADRTRVEDVRSLVAMLVQTDRFGTSVAQALRTHADTARTKRRQRAEERAAKLSVKLVFPLVFFLFPALYVVILGPAVIKILEVFGSNRPQ